MNGCAHCGGEVSIRHPNTLVEVVGWDRPNQERQGGQNHVIDRRQTGRVLCGECGNRFRLGLNPGQTSLIDEGQETLT